MSERVGDWPRTAATLPATAPATAPVVSFPPASNAGVRALSAELRERRVPFVTATVVRAERPTSAKAGDIAIVLGDGRMEGFVGGDCAETSVRLQALRALAARQPLLLHISPDAALTEEATDAHGTVTVHNPCLSGGTIDVFLEPELPAPVIVIHGESPIARALARLAEPAGYVVVTTTGAAQSAGEAETSGAGQSSSATQSAGGAQSTDELVAGASVVVVASHGRAEEGLLESAVRAGVGYVGLVASQRRGAAVLDRLHLSEEARGRIHTPAGLDLGARSPEEIAISILAEVVETRRQATPSVNAAAREAPESAGSAIDPVCGMTVAAVRGSLQAEHAGSRYFFCGPGCKDAFVSGPEGFLGRS